MAFCSSCGAQLSGNEKFCPACGGVQAASEVAENTTVKNGTNDFPKNEVESGKVIAILLYIFPILFFLPLVIEPKTEYGTFHANQGLVLLLAYAVSSLLTIVLIGLIGYVLCFVFQIIGILNAINGSRKPLPLIGGITIIK